MFVEASTSGQTPALSQSSLTERRAVNKSATDKLSETIVEWIVGNCRLINVVEDIDFTRF